MRGHDSTETRGQSRIVINKQDYQQAVFWYQKAANQGDKDAEQRIEELLRKQPELKKLMGNAHNFYSPVSTHSPNPKEAQSYSLQ